MHKIFFFINLRTYILYVKCSPPSPYLLHFQTLRWSYFLMYPELISVIQNFALDPRIIFCLILVLLSFPTWVLCYYLWIEIGKLNNLTLKKQIFSLIYEYICMKTFPLFLFICSSFKFTSKIIFSKMYVQPVKVTCFHSLPFSVNFLRMYWCKKRTK